MGCVPPKFKDANARAEHPRRFGVVFVQPLTAEGVTIKSATAIGALAGFTHVPLRHFIRGS